MESFIIVLPKDIAKKFKQILKDEEMSAAEWLENAVEDYDS